MECSGRVCVCVCVCLYGTLSVYTSLCQDIQLWRTCKTSVMFVYRCVCDLFCFQVSKNAISHVDDILWIFTGQLDSIGMPRSYTTHVLHREHHVLCHFVFTVWTGLHIHNSVYVCVAFVILPYMESLVCLSNVDEQVVSCNLFVMIEFLFPLICSWVHKSSATQNGGCWRFWLH